MYIISKKTPTSMCSYNAVIIASSKSSINDAAICAMELLNLFLTENNTTTEPDAISFSSVLDAWAKINTEKSAK